MLLSRRIRHRASRREILREVFYVYILTFVVMFLYLHFGKSYSPLSGDKHLSVNAAAREAMLWALAGSVLWAIGQAVQRGTDLWNSYSGLDWQMQQLVLGGAVALAVATFISWRWMLPLWGLVAAVVLFLRFSRPKDSL